MTTKPAITTTTSTEQNQEPGQEQQTRTRPLPDTDRYTEQTTGHDQQDTRTKRSRERSEDAHLGITIRGSRPASGRPVGAGCATASVARPLSIFTGSSRC